MKLINKTLMIVAFGSICMISSVAMSDLLKPILCGQNEYTPTKYGECVVCPQNATCDGKTATCKSGYLNVSTVAGIVECEKSPNIPILIRNCGSEKLMLNTASGDCVPCPDNAVCDGLVITKCNQGYKLSGDRCVLDSTTNCGENRYRSASTNTCVSCPANATCDGVTAKCKPGYIDEATLTNNVTKVGSPLRCVPKINKCESEEDCPQPKCLGCRSLCIEGQCTMVQCKDHGKYDTNTHKCICDKGWTGKYCETRVSVRTCQSVSECPQPKCIGCVATCTDGICGTAECFDHGKRDANGQCICNKGWTGKYCETTIQEEPKPIDANMCKYASNKSISYLKQKYKNCQNCGEKKTGIGRKAYYCYCDCQEKSGSGTEAKCSGYRDASNKCIKCPAHAICNGTTAECKSGYINASEDNTSVKCVQVKAVVSQSADVTTEQETKSVGRTGRSKIRVDRRLKARRIK